MHDLMNDAQAKQMNDEELIIEQFKIEDAIFPELDIEKEHIIQLTREIQAEQWLDTSMNSSTQANTSAAVNTTENDLDQSTFENFSPDD